MKIEDSRQYACAVHATIRCARLRQQQRKVLATMKIYKETSFENFEPWSGAKDTFWRIIDEGKADEFEAILEDLYPDGMDETDLNDLLWFDDEWCFEVLGISEEEEEEEEEE